LRAVDLLLALLLAAVGSTVVHAQAPDPTGSGIDAAYEICNELAFDADKKLCRSHVGSGSYFQPGLLGICSKLPSHGDRAKCLGVVKDKTAGEAAMKGCEAESWWGDVEECLTAILRPYVPPAIASPAPAADDPCKKGRVSFLIDESIRQCKAFQYLELYHSLVELRSELTLCGYE